MNIDILHRPTALRNLLAGRIWPAGRRLPMHGIDNTNIVGDKGSPCQTPVETSKKEDM